jgi:hypothetical protein
MRLACRENRKQETWCLTRGTLGGTDGVERTSKKELLVAEGDRTKTDTGRWEEYSQAREITLVKELCKLSL